MSESVCVGEKVCVCVCVCVAHARVCVCVCVIQYVRPCVPMPKATAVPTAAETRSAIAVST